MEKRLLCLTLLLCAVTVASVFIYPTPALLADENRPYTVFSYAAIDDFLFDRLPGRRALLTLSRDKALFLSQNEFGGAICGKDGYLFSIPQTDVGTLSNNLGFLSAYAAQRGIPLQTVLVPNKAEVQTKKLPRFFTCARPSLWAAAKGGGVGLVDVRPILRAAADGGKYVYYRRDHHLTSLGSFEVYRQLQAPLGYTARRDAHVEVLDADFVGSEARKMLLPGGDRLAIFRFAGDERIYHLDKKGDADPYGVFPGYLCGYTRIENGNARRMLMFCDSFGCALVPHLCRDFDVDMVDLRYAGRETLAKIKETSYDMILAYFGMDTLAGYELFYQLDT